MERVLPKTINYLDVLPKAIPSERHTEAAFAEHGFESGQ